MKTPDLEFVRSLHESFLADLEGLAVEAIASNNWDAFYAHVVNFQNEHDLHGHTGIAIGEEKVEASTKDLPHLRAGFVFSQADKQDFDKE